MTNEQPNLSEVLLAQASDDGSRFAPCCADHDAERYAALFDAFMATLDTLRLVKSMRTIQTLSPAEHDFERAKHAEAWTRIDEKIAASLGE